MKKSLLFLVAILASVCLLAACGAPAATTSPSTSPEDTNISVPNPVVEVEDAEAIRQQLGLNVILPEDAQDVTFSIISDEIAQANFVMDGSNYTYRIKKSGAFEDISGVFDTFQTTQEMTWEDYPYTLSYNEGGAGLSTWYDQATAASYTLYMDAEATETTLVHMTQALIPAG